MLSKSYPFYLANEARQPNLDLEVTDKYSGEVATRVPLAGPEDISAGIAGESTTVCLDYRPVSSRVTSIA